MPRKRVEQTPTFEVWALKATALRPPATAADLARVLLSVGRSDYDRARVGVLVHEGIVDLKAHWRRKFPPDQARAADFEVDAVIAAIDRQGVWVGDGIAVIRRGWKRPERWDKGLSQDERRTRTIASGRDR